MGWDKSMPKPAKEEFIKLFGRYFPPETIEYAYFYFNRNGFYLKAVKARSSKKGDFRYSRLKDQIPTITINADLCPYDFLLVYLHELAHYLVYQYHDINQVKSHGKEWKEFFKKLLLNLTEQVPLPAEIKQAFRDYSTKIKGTTSSDRKLETVLNRYRPENKNTEYLIDLAEGDLFICRDELFRLDTFARTRARCTLLRTKRKYIIPGMMNVQKYIP